MPAVVDRPPAENSIAQSHELTPGVKFIQGAELRDRRRLSAGKKTSRRPTKSSALSYGKDQKGSNPEMFGLQIVDSRVTFGVNARLDFPNVGAGDRFSNRVQ